VGTGLSLCKTSQTVVFTRHPHLIGWKFILGCFAVCVVGWESYGFGRCSVLVRTGILKFLLLLKLGGKFAARVKETLYTATGIAFETQTNIS
jgi:hypothetical protein